MKLKEGRKYHFQFKDDKMFFRNYGISEKFKNIPLKVIFKEDFLRIIDKRFIHSHYYDFGFYLERFVIKEDLQLELDF